MDDHLQKWRLAATRLDFPIVLSTKAESLGAENKPARAQQRQECACVSASAGRCYQDNGICSHGPKTTFIMHLD